MMKRIVSSILIMLLLVSFVSCGNEDTQSPVLPPDNKENVENDTDVIDDENSGTLDDEDTDKDKTEEKVPVAYEAKYTMGYWLKGRVGVGRVGVHILKTKAELMESLVEVDGDYKEGWEAVFLQYDEAFFENNVLIVCQFESQTDYYPIVEGVCWDDQEFRVSMDAKHVNGRQFVNSHNSVLLSVSLEDAKDITAENVKCNFTVSDADWQAYDAACDLYGVVNKYKEHYGEKWYEELYLGKL